MYHDARIYERQVNLIIELRLLPRLKMLGAVPPFPYILFHGVLLKLTQRKRRFYFLYFIVCVCVCVCVCVQQHDVPQPVMFP